MTLSWKPGVGWGAEHSFQQSLCSEGVFPVLGPPCDVPKGPLYAARGRVGDCRSFTRLVEVGASRRGRGSDTEGYLAILTAY